ncbi:unnamed protein product [Urochloa decumbens]|uniref:F-box domain-containing protein n=1 Tax=Urochloa decumbens TaxID=240449 RepID=A0ABC9FMX0_9POAL
MDPPRPMPELIDDVIAEILLRLPSDEPRCLFRASLACLLWRRLLTDAAFVRRYRRFHRTPPLLGFFFMDDEWHNNPICCFIPTTSPSPFPRTMLNCRTWAFRHISKAVLCAMARCDHSDYHRGPFLVVWVTKDPSFSKGYARVYSSRVGSWGSCASVVLGIVDPINLSHATVVGDQVYFMLQMGARILQYDLAKHHLSVIDPPEWYYEGISLVSTEDSLLGVTVIRGSNLHL